MVIQLNSTHNSAQASKNARVKQVSSYELRLGNCEHEYELKRATRIYIYLANKRVAVVEITKKK